MQESLELAYNTDNNNLIIPEYGRNVHRMVQHAMTISDKNERNKCAETIVKIMDLINPNSKKNSNARLEIGYGCKRRTNNRSTSRFL